MNALRPKAKLLSLLAYALSLFVLHTGWAYADGPMQQITSGPAAPENHWAVLIGIDRYQDTNLQPLQFAVSDTQAMEEALLGLGFESDHIFHINNKDATRENILELLGDKLPALVDDDDSVMVYWSGHGLTEALPDDRQTGYLIPYDGDSERPFATAIPMQVIHELSQRTRASHMLFLMDACYSGLALKGSRAHLNHAKGTAEDIIQKYGSQPSRQVITAGQAGEKVLETEGHGMFTRYVLQALDGKADTDDNGVLAGGELAGWLRARVTESSSLSQTPQYARWDGEGEYVLVVDELATTEIALLDLNNATHRGVDNTAFATSPPKQFFLPPSVSPKSWLATGVAMVGTGTVLYFVGQQSCDTLGSDECNAHMKPLIGTTIGLWSGGAIAAGWGISGRWGHKEGISWAQREYNWQAASAMQPGSASP